MMTRILLIEPDRQLALVIQKYLQSDCIVDVCHDAQSAIAAADAAAPDIVVLELAMAEHNGIAFLQEFRSYADWISVPVIIYSHIPRSEIGLTDLEWKKAGVVEYLYKTTGKLSNLAAAVRRHVKDYEAA